MCDPSDLHVIAQIKAVHNGKPTIFLYDRYPGGVGLSKRIYETINDVINEALQLIEFCPCTEGCPSCIGADIVSKSAKNDTHFLLSNIKDGTKNVVEK